MYILNTYSNCYTGIHFFLLKGLLSLEVNCCVLYLYLICNVCIFNSMYRLVVYQIFYSHLNFLHVSLAIYWTLFKVKQSTTFINAMLLHITLHRSEVNWCVNVLYSLLTIFCLWDFVMLVTCAYWFIWTMFDYICIIYICF